MISCRYSRQKYSISCFLSQSQIVLLCSIVGYLWEPIASVIDQGVQKWKGGGVSSENKHRRLWLGNQGLWNNSLLDWTRHRWRQREGWEAKCSFCELRTDKMLQYVIDWGGNTHTHRVYRPWGRSFIAHTVTSYVHITMMMSIISGGHWALGGRRCCHGYTVCEWVWPFDWHLNDDYGVTQHALKVWMQNLDVEDKIEGHVTTLHVTRLFITGFLYQLKHLLMCIAFKSYMSIQWKMFVLEKYQKVRDASHMHRIV